MVGRVAYLGRVKQGNYHTHVLYTIPNPNYTLPKPYPFIITYPIHHPTLNTKSGRVLPCASINITLPWIPTYPHPLHSDTLPEYLPYPTNRRKNIASYIEYLPHLPHPRHLSLHTCNHLTLPSITYPNLHFPIRYYCQYLIYYKAETTYQIRPKRPSPKRLRAKMTQTKTTRECGCGCRTCRVVHFIIWLSIFVRVRIFWTSNIYFYNCVPSYS